MKKVVIASSIVALLSLVSCGDSNNSSNDNNNSSANHGNNGNNELPTNVQDAINAPKSTMNQELKNILSFMGNEERLAYDVYNALYQKFPDVKQLYNIPTKSEYKHIQAVQLLVQKYIDSDADFTNVDLPPLNYKNTPIEDMQPGVYDIEAIQNLYNTLYAKGKQSKQDALKVGCIIEVTDINDLNVRIATAQDYNATDIETVLNFLRDGSYSHYWAFDQGLKNLGVSDGCCSLGVIDGVDYCQPNYPKK